MRTNKDRIDGKEEEQRDEENLEAGDEREKAEKESEGARIKGNRIKVKWKEGEEEIEDIKDRRRIEETREERIEERKEEEETGSEEILSGLVEKCKRKENMMM